MILVATPLPTQTQDPSALSTGKPFIVDVSGKTMTLHCYGSGSPVVVLESGLSADWSYWGNVIDGLKKELRVCAYERHPASKSSLQYAEDLHNLLAKAGLQGPFILVGHSYGGLNVIVYAGQYPEEVAGILLEDILEPECSRRLLAALPPERVSDSQDLKDLRRAWSTPRLIVQGVDVTASCEQAQAVKSLGDIPLIVLTAAAPNPSWGDFPEAVQTSLNAARQAMQKELVGLSTQGRQIIASTSEHTIHDYAPREVIVAIIELIQLVRR
jgi:pimeloyl-ACP methyl ester carboxylesterase